MTKRMCFFVASIIAPLALASNSAEAATCTNPYTTETVIKAGSLGQYGSYVAFQRVSDNACSFCGVGDMNGLQSDVMVYGGPGRDNISINTGFGTFCGYDSGPLVYNGHYMDLAGLGGSDKIWTSSGDTWAWGGNGNDWIMSTNPTGTIYGEAGDDQLHNISGSGGNSIYGGDGSDCMSDYGASAAAYDCGSGTDQSWSGETPVNAIGCESWSATSCPYL